MSDGKAEKLQAENDEAKRKSLCMSLMTRADFPKRHLAAMGSLENVPAWAKAREDAWSVVSRGDSLLLCGKRGTGKTQIAIACGVRLIEESSKSVIYLKASQLFREAVEAMHDNRQSQYISGLCRIGLLIVDEAHVCVGSAYEDRTMTEIVDRRYDATLPTILITNQDKKEAAESLGPSIVSRYTESGMAIDCNWQSFRVNAQAKRGTTK